MWDNRDLVLYHGTTMDAARDIEREGIEFGEDGRLGLDFGRGFYTTTNRSQAEERARQKSAGTALQPALVRFVVPRDVLATLESEYFVRGDRLADDFWDFVEHCREGHDHGRTPPATWYDVVAGPLAPWAGRKCRASRDQVSVHTEAGRACLDAHLQDVIPVDDGDETRRH